MAQFVAYFAEVLVSFSVSWVVGNGLPVCLRR